MNARYHVSYRLKAATRLRDCRNVINSSNWVSRVQLAEAINGQDDGLDINYNRVNTRTRNNICSTVRNKTRDIVLWSSVVIME